MTTNFPNDGFGYDVYAELMAKRAEADQLADYEAMRGNVNEMSEDLIRQQMADEAKEHYDEYPVTLDADMMAALDASDAQEIELTRFNSNEEAEHARFNSGNNSNLQGC